MDLVSSAPALAVPLLSRPVKHAKLDSGAFQFIGFQKLQATNHHTTRHKGS